MSPVKEVIHGNAGQNRWIVRKLEGMVTSLPDKHFHGGVRAVVARRRNRHIHRRSGTQALS